MTKAYVLLSIELGSEQEVIPKLREIENVKEVHGTLGLYDVLAKVEAPSEQEINKTITEKIRKMPKIHSTITLKRAEGGEYFQADSNKLMGSILGKNTAQAYVVLHTDQGEEYNVLRNLSNIPEVKEADVVFGYYDVLGKIEASSHKELEKIITKDVRKLSHVRTSMTLNVILEQE